ncbi:MAG: hypothetical protein AAGN35_17805 [Bacteroidota bacterium]
MHRLITLVTCLFAISFSGCSLFDRPEDIPAYLEFRNPRVILDDNSTFTSNIGIRDVWLYQGGFLQGIYPVNPVEDSNWVAIPVINLENNDFFIDAGIHETGQSSFHLPYPFWDRIEFTLDLTPGDTFVVEPEVRYVEEERYLAPVYERFDGGLIDLVPFNSSLIELDSTFVRLSTTEVFRGNSSGFVNFGPDDRWFEAINSTPFQLDKSKDVYLEITYKNSVPLEVGLVYQNISGLFPESVVTITPKEDWNTIYIHLIEQTRNILNLSGDIANFWIWLRADGEGNDGYIYLDDIRLIRER